MYGATPGTLGGTPGAKRATGAGDTGAGVALLRFAKAANNTMPIAIGAIMSDGCIGPRTIRRSFPRRPL